MCVCTRGRAAAAAACASLEYFDFFSLFFLWELKRPRKYGVFFCVEGRIMWAACVPVPASPPHFFPAANLDGGGADIWEQFLSAPAKVVKGLISSHAVARAKKNSFLQEFNTIYPSRQVFQYGRQA